MAANDETTSGFSTGLAQRNGYFTSLDLEATKVSRQSKKVLDNEKVVFKQAFRL